MIFWPDPGFYAYEDRYKLSHMQRCIRSLSYGNPACASDFVYVNKSTNVAHLCRHDERKKLVHLVNLAQFEWFWDCGLSLF